jgi:transglutaminase-like putative cysteine protease
LKNTTFQHIEIVGLTHPVVFALDRLVAIELPPPPTGSFFALDIEPRFSGELNLRQFRVNPNNPFDRRYPTPEFFGGSYLAFSRPTDALASHVRFADEEQLGADLLEPYLLLPTNLSPRVRELAGKITKGKTTSENKITDVIGWLQRTHGYSTTLGRNDHIADPLEDFLFEQSVGHCEYFASAAAILLRLAGVPTRYVNGFLGGEWNDLQRMVTVRENRAHAWVEAYLGQRGWVRIDPTPPQAQSTRMNGLRQLLDASELFFSHWVLEYNASQQLRLAESLSRQFGFSGRDALIRKPLSPMTRRQATLVALTILALLILWKTRHWFRRIVKPRGTDTNEIHRGKPGVIRLYSTTLHRLRRAGLPRIPSETPHEYLQRLQSRGIEGAQVLAELTRFYTEARYGDRQTPHETLIRLQEQASIIRPAA